MELEDQLKSIILSKYKSVRAFCLEAGVPYTTVDSILKRGIRNAGVNTIIKIFRILELDVESVATEQLKAVATTACVLTSKEEILLSNYRILNEEGQEKLFDYSQDLVGMDKYKKSYKLNLDSKEA